MAKLDIDDLLAALERVYGARTRPIALHEPSIGEAEIASVNECLRSGWVSSASTVVDRFEQRLADFTGARNVISVVNGTSALHLALHALGVGVGDEVLVPALTFVATANAVAYCGAEPHFVDSSSETLGIETGALGDYLQDIVRVDAGRPVNRRSGAKLAAIVAVHTFGHPVDIDRLRELAARYRLPIVEDAAEALGSRYHGRHVGNDGILGVLSFNGNKVLTCGGGGAVMTSDDRLAARVRHLSSTGRVPHRWEIRHDVLGFNYRMPGLNAALGLGQMDRLEDNLLRKRNLAGRYHSELESVGGVCAFRERDFAQSNYWLNVALLDRPDMQLRDRILDRTNSAGIGTRPAWHLMSELPMYQHCQRMSLEGSLQLVQRLVALPSSPSLGSSV